MLLSFPSYMENNTLENVSIDEEEQIYKGIVVHVLAKRYTVSGQGTIIRTNKKGQPYKGIVIFMIDYVKQPIQDPGIARSFDKWRIISQQTGRQVKMTCRYLFYYSWYIKITTFHMSPQLAFQTHILIFCTIHVVIVHKKQYVEYKNSSSQLLSLVISISNIQMYVLNEDI